MRKMWWSIIMSQSWDIHLHICIPKHIVIHWGKRGALLKTIILNFKTSVAFYIANSDCPLFYWKFILWEDIDRYLNDSFSLLLVLNFPHKTRYPWQHFEITSDQLVKWSNQLNKIEHYVKHEQGRKICNNLEALHISKICTSKGNIKCLKKLCFTGKKCGQRSMYKPQTILTSVGCWKKKSEFSQNSIEGPILKPKSGSSSVAVTNLSTWPRITLPLLPPAMNIHSVVGGYLWTMLENTDPINLWKLF